MNRYRLRLTSGEEVVFEARPGDVDHQESGIRVWEGPRKSRFYPYVSVLEESCERVEWRAVS